MTLNKTLLIGNLGADPEIRVTQNGKEIAFLSVATSDRYTDRQTGEKKQRTDWHRIVVFTEGLINKLIKPYLKKGSNVIVEGRLQTRSYEKDGDTRYVTEIVASSLSFGNAKGANAAG